MSVLGSASGHASPAQRAKRLFLRAKILALMILSGLGSICTPATVSTAQMEAILPAQLGRDCPEIGEDGIDQLDGKHLAFCGFQRGGHRLQDLIVRFDHELNRDALFS